MMTPEDLRRAIDAEQEQILRDLALALQPHVIRIESDVRGVSPILVAAALFAFGDTIYLSLDANQRQAFTELRKKLGERMKR